MQLARGLALLAATLSLWTTAHAVDQTWWPEANPKLKQPKIPNVPGYTYGRYRISEKDCVKANQKGLEEFMGGPCITKGLGRSSKCLISHTDQYIAYCGNSDGITDDVIPIDKYATAFRNYQLKQGKPEDLEDAAKAFSETKEYRSLRQRAEAGGGSTSADELTREAGSAHGAGSDGFSSQAAHAAGQTWWPEANPKLKQPKIPNVPGYTYGRYRISEKDCVKANQKGLEEFMGGPCITKGLGRSSKCLISYTDQYIAYCGNSDGITDDVIPIDKYATTFRNYQLKQGKPEDLEDAAKAFSETKEYRSLRQKAEAGGGSTSADEPTREAGSAQRAGSGNMNDDELWEMYMHTSSR